MSSKNLSKHSLLLALEQAGADTSKDLTNLTLRTLGKQNRSNFGHSLSIVPQLLRPLCTLIAQLHDPV